MKYNKLVITNIDIINEQYINYYGQINSQSFAQNIHLGRDIDIIRKGVHHGRSCPDRGHRGGNTCGGTLSSESGQR